MFLLASSHKLISHRALSMKAIVQTRHTIIYFVVSQLIITLSKCWPNIMESTTLSLLEKVGTAGLESSLKPLQLWLTCNAYGTSQLVCSSAWNWLEAESILNVNFDTAWGLTYLLYHMCHHHHFDVPFLSALTKEKGFTMWLFPNTALTIISSVLFWCRTIRKKTATLRH